MKKQFLKFPFTPAGVARWQLWLAGLSPVQRNDEANLVEQSLYTYLPYRFALRPEQVAFLDDLAPMLCALWATQIAYAIRQGIPIELIKPVERGEAGVMNTKYIESEGSTGSGPGRSLAAKGEESGYYLRFMISY